VRRRQTVDIDGRRLPPANAPLVSSAIQLVGDYANPILRPAAAEVVKKHAEMSLAGVGYPSPRNQCWPEGVPFIFTNSAVQLLQQPDKITMLYDEDHEVRRAPSSSTMTRRVSRFAFGPNSIRDNKLTFRWLAYWCDSRCCMQIPSRRLGADHGLCQTAGIS
jgi:hypothetical protein